uniref:Cell death inducing DFFA like effector c n=1 Tax=Oryctolagus cuniculus TaxID=9986 RepID=A0A5F9DC68_RABIT
MEYAVKSLSRLYPKSSSRQVAVRTSVVTQQLLSEPSLQGSRARPCRVSTADRKERKGFSAHSLEDLRHKGSPALGPPRHAGHRPHAARHLLVHAEAPGRRGGWAAAHGQGLSPAACLPEDTALRVLGPEVPHQ